MARSSIEDAVKGYAIVTLVYLVSWLPFRFAQWLGAGIGWCHWRLRSATARVTFTNLELCLPELDHEGRNRLARASLMHTGRTLMETPGIWFASRPRNIARVRRVVGEELLASAREKGKGVILLLPHLGNWEIINSVLGAGPGMTALYQPPDLPLVHTLMQKARDNVGNEIVPPTRRGLTKLFRALEGGGIVVLLPDQVPASGEFAPFFGIEAMTDVLAPHLAKRTGAELLCVCTPRVDRGRFDVVYRAARPGIDDVDDRRAAAALNASIEACVREFPGQYQWEYKRFKERPPGAPRLYH